MNLHEFQAKQLFSQYQIAVPEGGVIDNREQINALLERLGGERWVVKAQVHAGGRGKAGGVRLVSGREELTQAVDALLGQLLVTHQSAADGLPINQLLIERVLPIKQELYLGALVDRAKQRIVFMASPAGGMDIEQVAAEQPENIFTIHVDPVTGVMPFQCRQLIFKLQLSKALMQPFADMINALYAMFVDKDLSLVEINPLVITDDDRLIALDAKINVDDNALFRQADLLQFRDVSQEDQRESEAQQHQLNYISLDGNIGCMVNGAGLAMATMDLIKLHGGDPANFLDVGGGITVDRVVEAFKLVISSGDVKAILVNIFGGIVRCDLIADGIIQAMRQVAVSIPVVVRLEGTNVEMGRQMLAESGLSVITAEGLTDAARKVIKAANEHASEDDI